jgi:hypothetical protein
MVARLARRWYQFSLKTLLVVMALSSVPPAVYVGYQRYLVAKRLAEIEGSFRWLESLGYPQLPNSWPVQITIKQWYGDQDPSEARTSVIAGFLLSEDEKSFTVLTPALHTIPFERESWEEWAKSEASFRRVDLPTLARMALDQIQAKDSDPLYRFGHDFSERGELFVLAWACARQGYSDWAIKLYEEAEALHDLREKGDAPLLERLAADFAHMETWRATLDCGTQMPRPEVLKKFRLLEEHFPNSEHAADVSEKVAILELMVVEDERHARQREAGLPFDQLSQSDQIAELIFQLRDQNGYQFSQPGSCNVLMTPDGEEDSPGHRLLAYGYDAIPQLAAALSDQRLTRSVEYHRSFYFSHHVLTIGDAAEQILEHIASRRFDTAERYESKAERIANMQKSALAWHAQVMTKGERLCLIEAVERGDDTALELADRLLEKYPDEACSAILVAIPWAKDEHRRRDFVELLGRVDSDESVPFLLAELERKTIWLRLAAAKALTDIGRPEGIDGLLHQWQSSQNVAELGGVGPFLARCGRPDAVEAVAQRFSEQPIDQRLESMDEAMRFEADVLAQQPRLRKAEIKLLLRGLADTEVRKGMGGSRGSKSYTDPRVCDLAGYHLNCLDASAFPFDLGAQFSQREAARLAILAARGH